MEKTYVMLNNSIQGSFIKEEIIKEFGITGKKLKLSLKALTDEKSEELAAVDGLVVSGISCGKAGSVGWIEIPKVYSISLITS